MRGSDAFPNGWPRLMRAQASSTHAQATLAQQRISVLAAQPATHRAFSWLHLHQPQMRQWLLDLLSVPAPPFGESKRAAWFADRFLELGLSNVHTDAAGNVLGELTGELPGPMLLVSAHLDTVFPAGTEVTPRQEESVIFCPGACDNGAGLSALLGLAAAMRAAEITPRHGIVFAANTGEEGEGNLRGMRELFSGAESQYRGRVGAALALEGAGTSTAVTAGLGSRRFRVTLTGPGGHSWTDAGAPNPITLMARAITLLAELPMLHRGTDSLSRTTLSAGQISGGSSVNSIPEQAVASFDLRSTSAPQLEALALELHRCFEGVVGRSLRERGVADDVKLRIENIGDRPAAVLSDEAGLLHTLRAVDRHLGLRTELRMGSTDANLPLSLGVQAAALSAGGTGGGIHTLGEWYDPAGRETALRRILLVALDLAATLEG